MILGLKNNFALQNEDRLEYNGKSKYKSRNLIPSQNVNFNKIELTYVTEVGIW